MGLWLAPCSRKAAYNAAMRRQLIVLILACGLSDWPLARAQITVPATTLEGQDGGACSQSVFSDDKQSAAPQITIAEFAFDGDLHMPIEDQARIAASLKERIYSGDLDGMTSEVLESTRRAWQDHGYFKVQAQGKARVLTGNPVSKRVAVTVQIDEGEQYRLEGIRFRGNKEISNETALRSLFPLKDGDIFSREEIVKGLDNMRFAYRQVGHINFTSIPIALFDEGRQSISLEIDIDEGKRFYVSGVNIVGLDDRVLEDSLLKQGSVYDQRLVDLFLQEHASSLLPGEASLDSHIHLQLDERAATVAITFDFRRCPAE
jgi:outer membrane translocation and assembly module TamA